DGLRYEDEFVKHKILDAIGDLYLLGKSLVGEFRGFKSGHALNNKLLRALLAKPDAYEIVTFEDAGTAPISFMRPAAAVCFLLVSFDGHFGGRFFCLFVYLEACLEVLRKVSLGDRAGLATEASWLLPESHRRLGVCRRSGMQGYVLANDGGSGL